MINIPLTLQQIQLIAKQSPIFVEIVINRFVTEDPREDLINKDFAIKQMLQNFPVQLSGGVMAVDRKYKIPMIKLYRTLCSAKGKDCGLKAAKDFVEKEFSFKG